MMRIYLKRSHETIDYAAEELKKYVTTLSRGSVVPCVFCEESCKEQQM